MNADIKKRWIEALTSGEYMQGQGYLNSNNNYCCLGVLCDLHAKETHTSWLDGTYSSTYLNNDDFLPTAVREWAGLNNGESASVLDDLVEKNDDFGTDFAGIAKIIEEKL